MSKVYMRAEDNEAGVTVKDTHGDEAFVLRYPVELRLPGTCLCLKEAEARAVVEGLLRRMVEKDGADAVHDWLCKTIPTVISGE